MKSRTHLKQTGNPPIKLDPPSCRLRYSRQHLEQGRLARAVSANDADYFAGLDLKAHILHRPKLRWCRPPVALQKTQRRTRHTRQSVAQTSVRSLMRAQPVTLPQILKLDNGFHRLSSPSRSEGKYKTCFSLCILSVLCVSVVSVSPDQFTTEGTEFTEIAQRSVRFDSCGDCLLQTT